jgi:hypothetical protein
VEKPILEQVDPFRCRETALLTVLPPDLPILCRRRRRPFTKRAPDAIEDRGPR